MVGSGSSSADGGIKREGQTEIQKLEKRITAFKAKKQEQLRTYQDMLANTKIMHKKAVGSANKKYAMALIEDLNKQVAKLTRAVKILERMLVEEPNDVEMPKLFSMLDECSDNDIELQEWGARFGFVQEKELKKAKRARANK